MQLRAVDLPQPEGPRKVTNSPLPNSSEKSSTAVFSPKRFVMRLTEILLKSFIAPCVAAAVPARRYFLILAPTSWSHMSMALTNATGSSWVVLGTSRSPDRRQGASRP